MKGVNTSYSFIDYLLRLTECLDAERPGWRKTHVVVCDNNSSHTSQVTRRVLQYLRVPVCFTAPASFACLPVERAFGILRSKEYDLEACQRKLQETQPVPKGGFSAIELLAFALNQAITQI
jgi:hypothetical protein